MGKDGDVLAVLPGRLPDGPLKHADGHAHDGAQRPQLRVVGEGGDTDVWRPANFAKQNVLAEGGDLGAAAAVVLRTEVDLQRVQRLLDGHDPLWTNAGEVVENLLLKVRQADHLCNRCQQLDAAPGMFVCVLRLVHDDQWVALSDEAANVRAAFEQLRRVGREEVEGNQPIFSKQPFAFLQPSLPFRVLFLAVLGLDRPVLGLLILRQQDAQGLRCTEQIGVRRQQRPEE